MEAMQHVGLVAGAAAVLILCLEAVGEAMGTRHR